MLETFFIWAFYLITFGYVIGSAISVYLNLGKYEDKSLGASVQLVRSKERK